MKTFGLENVKAFRDTGDVELAPITIFVGQNSCGKSSFIRFPVVMAQSYLDETFPLCLHSGRSNLIDYGSFEDVLHNHEGTSFSCKFSFAELNSFTRSRFSPKLELAEQYIYYYKIFKSIGLESKIHNYFHDDLLHRKIYVKISYSQNCKTKTLIIDSYSVFCDNKLAFSITRDTSNGKYMFFQSIGILQGQIVDCQYQISLKVNSKSFSIDKLDALAKITRASGKYGIEAIVNTLKQKITESSLNDPIDNIDVQKCIAFLQSMQIKEAIDTALKVEMENTYYIGPFRNNPERIYRREETTIQNVGAKGEYASKMLINDNIGTNIIMNEVSRWFNIAFDYELCIEQLGNEYYQIVLVDTKTQTRSNIIDVGYGVSQVLPIVVQIAKASLSRVHGFSSSDELYVIEQPELHLHPAAQSKLADLFVNALSNNAIKYRKFLIETHSEHLIRALQVLIADPNCFLTNEMVKFYYVDKGVDGSVIKEMKTNEYGQFIERWPKGFFDEAHIMSRKLMDVVAERKNSEETVDD